MKVLQLGMSVQHGGVESFVLNYARQLAHYGITFDYVDLYGAGLAQGDQIIRSGSTIHTIMDFRKHPVEAYKKIRKIIAEGGYSCVHINMLSAASPVPVLAAMRTPAKVIMHSHNSQTVGLVRKVLHSINAVFMRKLPVTRLACSETAGKWMFGREKFEVIPNAIDPDRFRFDPEARASIRKSLGVTDDTLVLGFVGRLFPQKNPEYLTKILAAVKKKTTNPVKLLVVGDGELLDQLYAAADGLGITEDLLHAGHQEQMAAWYSAMDAFLLPSLWEGLPLVGIEAQAAGLPCFLSDRITEELVLTDLVHFCQLTDDAENWAEEILKNREFNADRKRYGSNIHNTKFSLHNAAEALYAIYCGKEDLAVTGAK